MAAGSSTCAAAVSSPTSCRQHTPGAVVDAITDRCRRGPLLLVVDDIEWMPATGVPAVEAVAAAAERLTLLVVVIADPDAGGPAIGALRRLPAALTTSLGPMPDADLARLVAADGVDDEGVTATLAVAGGLPGVARREAAAWAERAAGDRLQATAASSLGATAAAEEARSSVFDDVLPLVAARARRDELVDPGAGGTPAVPRPRRLRTGGRRPVRRPRTTRRRTGGAGARPPAGRRHRRIREWQVVAGARRPRPARAQWPPPGRRTVAGLRDRPRRRRRGRPRRRRRAR